MTNDEIKTTETIKHSNLLIIRQQLAHFISIEKRLIELEEETHEAQLEYDRALDDLNESKIKFGLVNEVLSQQIDNPDGIDIYNPQASLAATERLLWQTANPLQAEKLVNKYWDGVFK